MSMVKYFNIYGICWSWQVKCPKHCHTIIKPIENLIMRHIFDIDRTVKTYELYFDEHAEVLRELLRSVAGTLERVLPPSVSRQIDREGSRLVSGKDNVLAVELHPKLDEALQTLCRLGLFRTFLPKTCGGAELPVGLYFLAVQLVSYFDTSLALAFLVHGNASYVIDRYGTVAQKRHYLPMLAGGEKLATVAFTEPNAGSDAGSIQTRAVAQGDDFVLNGNKLFITHGGDADILVTTARTGSTSAKINGVSAFIVERVGDGVQVIGLEEKTGLSGSPTAALSYDDVLIPADRLLGRMNKGGEVMFAGVGMTRVNIGAQALGIAKRAFDAAVDYALEREQGGALIIEHDPIQQRLVDMALMISAMENLIARVSLLEHQSEWHVREMSITKYYCSEALQELTLRAINVFGGYGVSKDYVVEQCRREAAALPLYGGTSEIQWLIISREFLMTVEGTARVDYRERDVELTAALAKRCEGELAGLVEQTAVETERLWQLVETVSTVSDPVPFYRHLAELATSVSVAQVLLWQASSGWAGELEVRLAEVAVERLGDRGGWATERISGGVTRKELKRVLCGALGEGPATRSGPHP